MPPRASKPGARATSARNGPDEPRPRTRGPRRARRSSHAERAGDRPGPKSISGRAARTRRRKAIASKARTGRSPSAPSPTAPTRQPRRAQRPDYRGQQGARPARPGHGQKLIPREPLPIPPAKHEEHEQQRLREAQGQDRRAMYKEHKRDRDVLREAHTAELNHHKAWAKELYASARKAALRK